MNRRKFTCILFLVMILLLPACVPQPAAVPQATQEPAAEEGSEEAGAAAQDTRFGGKFTAAIKSFPPTLDSAKTLSKASSAVTNAIFEALVTFAEDYSETPMLAESWDVSDDGLTYTFHLRKGIKFHNGKEMTSADVEASVKRYMEVGARKAQLEIVESYEATDDYTFVIRIKAPSAAFLSALATPAGDVAILPKEIVLNEDGTIKQELNVPEDIIGTGPYKLSEYKGDQYIRLVRFDDYQPLPGERNGMGGAKFPYFDEIEMVFVPEAGARMAGLETGEYDWIEEVPESEIDRIESDPNMELVVVKPFAGVYLLFNHNEQFSGDLKFREAILAALDMEAVGMADKGGRRELFELNECIWPPEVVWHFEDEYAKSRYNQNDPETGKQLLQEAGYNGEEIVFAAPATGYIYRSSMAIAEQLKSKLGMNVRVETMDEPGLLAKWSEPDGWHLSATAYATPEVVNPDAAVGYWGSDATHPVLAFYNNPEMDAAFETLSRAATFEERKEGLKEVQRIFWEDLPNIKTHQTFLLEATRSDIKNYRSYYRARFFSVWREK